jgi:hypothetical protein
VLETALERRRSTRLSTVSARSSDCIRTTTQPCASMRSPTMTDPSLSRPALIGTASAWHDGACGSRAGPDPRRRSRPPLARGVRHRVTEISRERPTYGRLSHDQMLGRPKRQVAVILQTLRCRFPFGKSMRVINLRLSSPVLTLVIGSADALARRSSGHFAAQSTLADTPSLPLARLHLSCSTAPRPSTSQPNE